MDRSDKILIHMKSIQQISFGIMAAASLAACSPKVAATDASGKDGAPDATPCVTIRTDVPNKAFYKDVFMDGGLALSSNKNMPSLKVLGLTHEYIGVGKSTDENKAIQNSVMCCNENDANGVLLYPDGEPRFRMIYVNGGGADGHGRSIEYTGRQNLKQFVDNGGCYVGSCAGAYLIGTSYDHIHSGGYIGIWPGYVDGTSTPSWRVGYIIPEGSPLRKYSDFGGDFYIDSVTHHNGPFFQHYQQIPGTEVLAVNDYPAYKFHGYPSVIAYKADCFKGRVIPIGGHPEMVKGGERLELMCDIVRYALEGQGCAKAKAILSNGEMRRMTQSTEDNDPAHTKIGDRQCHHFVFALPKKARNIVVRLESLDNYELSLRLANGTFAFKEDAQYAAEGKDAVKELHFDELPAGTWYVGVQCESTVETKELGDHVEYSNTGILNGAAYSISVKWDNAATGRAVLAKGMDINEMIKKSINPALDGSDTDSTITRIVFRTGDRSTAGMRVDDRLRSEEPVYASIKDGVLTFTTAAAEFNSGTLPAFLFSGFSSVRSIDNLKALRTEEAETFMEIFQGCASLESIDLSGFKADRLVDANAMFKGCKLIKKIDISHFGKRPMENINNMLRLMPALEEVNLGAMEYVGWKDPNAVVANSGDKSNGTAKDRTVTIRCTRGLANAIASASLKAASVRFIDSATGEEFTPEWK